MAKEPPVKATLCVYQARASAIQRMAKPQLEPASAAENTINITTTLSCLLMVFSSHGYFFGTFYYRLKSQINQQFIFNVHNFVS